MWQISQSKDTHCLRVWGRLCGRHTKKPGLPIPRKCKVLSKVWCFCKGVLCLLNMLIEKVCVVSYDHYYDSLVKQRCKDWHWSSCLSTRGIPAVSGRCAALLSITHQCWLSFSPGLPDRPLSLPQENLQASLSQPKYAPILSPWQPLKAKSKSSWLLL